MEKNNESLTSVEGHKGSSGSGMTLKVLKGSVWVLFGQVLPLMATFITTPFVIRYLGSENYGVLLLVGLMATYFSFADFGMGLASTKFSAEAYADKDLEKEAMIVRTAAMLAFCCSLVFAIPMFIFSLEIMRDILKVPGNLLGDASLGLKITAVAFVINLLAGVINSPQLARLRMDLNMMIMTGGKLLMIIITPIILWLGGGIVEACLVSLGASVVMLAGNLIVSYRLLPSLFHISVSKKYFLPLFIFGRNIVYYAIGLTFMNYIERFILARTVSVSALSYYSIASTFAMMTTMFSMAMVQSLIPAFSQLFTPEKKAHLQELFSRTVRISLLGILPLITVLIVIAKPFFTIWAGPEFGRESIVPYYILMVGIFFGLLAYIPNSLLMASGKSSLFAKLYFLELIPYGIIVFVLIQFFGIIGAAISFTLKETVNALFSVLFARRFTGLQFGLNEYLKGFYLGSLFLVPPILTAVLFKFSILQILLLLLGLTGFSIMAFKSVLSPVERNWLTIKFKTLIGNENLGK